MMSFEACKFWFQWNPASDVSFVAYAFSVVAKKPLPNWKQDFLKIYIFTFLLDIL